MSSFGLFLIGVVLAILGLGYGAHLAGIALHWIVVGGVVLLGVGILAGVSRTRLKDPP
ncbi:hypothetical protein N8I74_17550 [Chitiniphilus purpureus]|uniref:DUF4175 domain-containing protein n=1 Tax=Chitiniphilus purpureus TaxID=2981137 RepID=A0ABY6DPU1_9NEIS|nr:hypothetical protein [Chitiniphilus sp. CD1]UXY15096.1 hypothetical protein N8I74_17550 [Chitiniphilus sp. CD1]